MSVTRKPAGIMGLVRAPLYHLALANALAAMILGLSMPVHALRGEPERPLWPEQYVVRRMQCVAWLNEEEPDL